MAQRGIGAAGWFSLGGFIIFGIIWILQIAGAFQIYPSLWSLIIAIVSVIGAVLFYVGNDPTQSV